LGPFPTDFSLLTELTELWGLFNDDSLAEAYFSLTRFSTLDGVRFTSEVTLNQFAAISKLRIL
jgi:hypothetical protein